MPKLCLCFVFNHQYEKNIPKLKEIFGNRFTTIRFLSPFSKSKDEQIIPVFETSVHFQGYFAQAYHQLPQDCDYYVFCGDDLILNPKFDENNLIESIGCQDAAYIKYLNPVWEHSFAWHKFEDCNGFPPPNCVVPYFQFLPQRKDLIRRYDKFGIKYRNLGLHNFLGVHQRGLTYERVLKGLIFLMRNRLRRYINFPLIEGYSDLIIIPKPWLERFCYYCGVFAAMNLWVDAAVATSMVLACEKIIQEKDHGFKGVELWGTDQVTPEKKYDLDFKKLLDDFPIQQLYLHPVKLSKWNFS